MSGTVGLNLSGKVFFGGLCVGTFYLGCWQTQRYFEKISLIDQRKKELADDPEPLTSYEITGFRRRLVEGRFRHEEEVLMGPRGPPPGALAASGPASGRSEGGMSSGPQVRFNLFGELLEVDMSRVTSCLCLSAFGIKC